MTPLYRLPFIFVHCWATAVIGLSINQPTAYLVPYSASRTTRGNVLGSKRTSGYDDTDPASKGLVSVLTSLVNSLTRSWSQIRGSSDTIRVTFTSPSVQVSQEAAPSSPLELMGRIRDDYTLRNYLWTGELDLNAFDEQCRFTDPTISFIGTEQFVTNIRNLRPIVDALVTESQSKLLSIEVDENEGYVQTRWNMVGKLEKVPWKPSIDVIGRTKFWYQLQEDNKYRVTFYDEDWEIPAGLALLQLVTPRGTIANTNDERIWLVLTSNIKEQIQ